MGLALGLSDEVNVVGVDVLGLADGIADGLL
jgi:hypothetical protein